ncbi:MAG: MBL fold metallo-hydrolase [Chlamydiia bacterium]|nr:MBL fold metallo-hydrolase [Chlamydiia bacterium]
MKGFCPLASGSKGNCIYLGTHQTKILIDCGLSGKATKTKLASIGVDLDEIQAILVSHEHSDHIQGLKVLALRKKIPVLANSGTAKGIYTYLKQMPQFKIFTTGETFTFGDLEIHPFSVQHDTVDPVMFTIKTASLKIGICTDLGFPTTLVKNTLKECDYLYLEANHQPSMVHACPRPMIYKQRVLGRAGHLCNEECGNLLKHVFHPKLRHVHLAHLSEECNHPATALQVVKEKLGEAAHSLEISIALQHTVAKAIRFE